jgi:hypothetical protein
MENNQVVGAASNEVDEHVRDMAFKQVIFAMDSNVVWWGLVHQCTIAQN